MSRREAIAGRRRGFFFSSRRRHTRCLSDWSSDVCSSDLVLRSSTTVVFVAPRAFMDDTTEDHAAIQPTLSQIDFYPLSQFDGKMKTKDWSKLPHFPAPKRSEERRVGKECR